MATIEAPNIRTSKTSFVKRLARAMRRSDERLAPHLRVRETCIKEFVGPRYGQDGKYGVKMPLATVYSYVTIMLPSISFGKVAIQGTSRNPKMRGLARLLGLRTTLAAQDCRMDVAIGQVVMDAMFGPAVAYLGLAPKDIPGGAADFTDPDMDPGAPYVSRISPDTFIQDDQCTEWDRALFRGHGAEWIIEDAIDRFPDKADAINDVSNRSYRERSAENLTKPDGHIPKDDLLYPTVNLAHIWLAREKVIVTIPRDADAVGDSALDEMEYVGVEGGPYRPFGFEFPPDNPFPVSIVANLVDMHWTLNALSRAIWRQAMRTKRVLAYRKDAAQDARSLAQSKDGQTVGVNDPKALQQYDFGGVSPDLWEALARFQDLFNYYGGNPASIGGLESKSKTLGQDQLQFGNAQSALGRMRGRVKELADWGAKGLAYYVATDQTSGPQEMDYPIKGYGKIPVQWTALDAREAEDGLDQMDMAMSAWPIGDTGPEQQFLATMGLLKEVAMPLAANAAAQGVYIDLVPLMNQLAQMKNLDEVDEWFTQGEPAQVPGMASPAAPTESRMPPQPQSQERQLRRSEQPQEEPMLVGAGE